MSLKDNLGWEIMPELVALRAKTYNYLIDDNNENIKVKDTRKSVRKRKLKEIIKFV